MSLEQCSSESSMICFTVMDHDVLTANDFAGEAFLALGTIPGVADYNTSVDNFHGLKQVELPLMQQTEKSKIHSINFVVFDITIFCHHHCRSSNSSNSRVKDG